MLVEKEAFERTLITNLDLAKAEGKVEGEAIGEARGIQKGIEKGKAKAKLEVARNLLAFLADDAAIAAAAGLSLEQVRALRAESNRR
jgi:predicted transposase/invertase (TIGR01784 family)